MKNSSLSLRAPAKINWFLTVLGKREDGYHDILSIMQCINLYDDLIFEHADTIEVVSDLDIPLEDNLIYRAASLLKRYTSYRKGAKIVLQKDIPVAAGLGGGSSNAAYTLRGLNMLWGLGLSNEELSSIGSELGSDVPFFLNGSFAFVEGRGERVTPLKINSSVVLLLVKPPISVPVAWAYANISWLTKKTDDIKLFCHTLERRNFVSLNTMLNNDLEKAVIEKYPVVGELKERLIERGAVISAMSGSGPTVFGVFDNRDTAKKAVKAMKPNWCRVVETVTSGA
ncbi:MAG: 4-(cytidine 5'-diphospho)-2-C-methyl-D-erythritol kinase [Nitrospirae bacterium]|nr:4-(cytidine 5'-diphospho)-2-C-methyl-D-erythritol kinase [Nitrospirota bacterium]